MKWDVDYRIWGCFVVQFCATTNVIPIYLGRHLSYRPHHPKIQFLYSWLLRFLRTTPFSIEVGSTIFLKQVTMTIAWIAPPAPHASHCCSKVSCLRALSLRPKLGVDDCPCWWLLMQNGANSNDENHDSCVFMKVTIMTISVVVLVRMMTIILIMIWIYASPLKSYPLCHFVATYFGHELWFVRCSQGFNNFPNKKKKYRATNHRPMTHKVHAYHLWYVYLAKWNILWAKSDDIYIYTHVIANQLVQFIILVPEVDHSIAIIWDCLQLSHSAARLSKVYGITFKQFFGRFSISSKKGRPWISLHQYQNRNSFMQYLLLKAVWSFPKKAGRYQEPTAWFPVGFRSGQPWYSWFQMFNDIIHPWYHIMMLLANIKIILYPESLWTLIYH